MLHFFTVSLRALTTLGLCSLWRAQHSAFRTTPSNGDGGSGVDAALRFMKSMNSVLLLEALLCNDGGFVGTSRPILFSFHERVVYLCCSKLLNRSMYHDSTSVFTAVMHHLRRPGHSPHCCRILQQFQCVSCSLSSFSLAPSLPPITHTPPLLSLPGRPHSWVEQ